ncbi:Forkhead box protein J3, partial [Linnemannia exigua]
MNLNSAMDDSQMILITAGTTAAAVETESSPGSEKRRRRVTEGHDTTTSPPAKAAKKVNTPAAVPNNSIDRHDVSICASTARPTCSYTTMLMEVFQASNKTKMDLPDIYGGVMAMYPYYRKVNKVWQSSVRHALSQSKFFCKMERGPDEPGKGSLWTVDTQNTHTPNPPRKRKASTSNNDYQSAIACPAKFKGKHSTAPTKLTCTTMGESLEVENTLGFHSSPTASIPSPAASDDTDDANTVRRSGRARRPPRTKEADDYVMTTTVTVSSHSRKPSLVMGASFSTPPSSPAPQDHHHSETTTMPTSMVSSAQSSARKRSSSIRSDKGLTSPAAVSRTNHHFTIELPAFNPKMSTAATSVVTSTATTTFPRRTPLNIDQDLVITPGVVTSPRIRRPPQKLAEFVSSEDFKAAPCGKRPAPPTSLGSASSSSSFLSENADRAYPSTLTSTSTPMGTGAGAGMGTGMGVTERRVERRGRKRARPDVVGAPSSISSTSQRLHTASPRRDRRTKDVDVVSPIGPQGTTTLPLSMTAQSPIGAVGGGAPAFISLKDLELSHAASLDDNDDEEDEDEEEDYFGVQGRRNYRSFSSSSPRRYGSSGRQSQHETYEQRRQAGIQQIVVASLDWYEESDSEDEVDVDVDVDVEGDFDADMDSSSHTSSHNVNYYGAAVEAHGGAIRSGFDSGFDSGSDSSKGFVRHGGWMMTETETAATTAAIAAELAGVGLEDIVGATAATEAFEAVCILAPEVDEQGVMDSTTAGDAHIDVTAVPSHFLQPARVLSGEASLAEQDGVHAHGSQVSPSVINVVDTSPLLLPITIDTSSSTSNLRMAASGMSG